MSAEIQPKKIRLAKNWAAFLPNQPNFWKKFGSGVYMKCMTTDAGRPGNILMDGFNINANINNGNWKMLFFLPFSQNLRTGFNNIL